MHFGQGLTARDEAGNHHGVTLVPAAKEGDLLAPARGDEPWQRCKSLALANAPVQPQTGKCPLHPLNDSEYATVTSHE